MSSGLTSMCAACSMFSLELAEISCISSLVIASNFLALERSAGNGCPLCQLVYQAIIYTHPGKIMRGWMREDEILIEAFDLSISSEGESDEDESGICDGFGKETSIKELCIRAVVRLTGIPLTIEPRKNNPREIINLNGAAYSSEDVDNIAMLAKSWLSNCSENHATCNKIRQMCFQRHPDPIIPTRLIDIGIEGVSTHLKLVIPTSTESLTTTYANYATLSYAWGSRGLAMKMTSGNLSALSQNIDMSSLPKTIQEAVIITRSLGIRYLWVDSLCIIQSEGADDALHNADWDRESARFAQYYESSIMTISATGAKDANEGLFLDRPALAFNTQPFTFKRMGSSGILTPVTIYPPAPEWSKELQEGPLMNRGWAAQERLLSRRVLHFSRNCILWECHELQATEMDPFDGNQLNKDMLKRDEIYLGSELQLNFRDLTSIPAELLEIYWYQYISLYSRMGFTYLSDRLPAISELATRTQVRLNQPYLAGIWEGTLKLGLAWATAGAFKSNSSTLSTPSWSWASSGGSVRFVNSYGDWEPLIQVREKQAVTTGLNMLGRVAQGRLTICGKFLVTNLQALKLSRSLHLGEGNKFERHSELTILDFQCYHALYLDSKDASDFDGTIVVSLLLGKLSLHSVHLPDWTGSDKTVAVSLVLEATGNQRNKIGEFKRVGLSMLPFRKYWSRVRRRRTIDLV